MTFSRFGAVPCRYTGRVMHARRTVALILAVACAAVAICNAPAGAVVTAQATVAAVAAAHPLPLDPSLSDPEWQAGAVSGTFENLTTRSTAPLATKAYILYDTANVYIAIRSEQRGVSITATQTTNDVGFGVDDFVGVGIDTSGNGTNSYYFEVTPRGVRYQQSNENARYRPQWSAAAKQDSGGWTAVLIVPLRIMRLHGGSPQSWRINFVRGIAANGEHYTWAYDGIMQDSGAGNWPTFYDVRFWPRWSGIVVSSAMLRSARPKPRAEVYGLESIGADRQMFAQSNGTFAPEHVRVAGTDVSYPVTSTINFVGTLNPDFSNVEIDQQTIAPQEFRRALQEYRPFFTQGANFINANAITVGNDTTFYSPSIGPFDRGAKIEGTFGMQSFGVMNFRGYDRTTGNEFDDIAYGYKHALPNRTFLYWVDGVLAHHSAFGHDATNEFGFAVRNLRTGFVGGIDSSQENAGPTWLPQRHASHSNAFIDVHKPNYEWNIGYSKITPNYNPIDGFTANSDVEGPIFVADTTAAAPGVKNFFAFLNLDRFRDRSGAVHQADFDLTVNATFRNGFSINGLGPSVGELRSYSLIDPKSAGTTCGDSSLPRSYFTGFPSYYCGRTDTFNLFGIPIGYLDGTPTPIDASVNFGRFGYGLVGANDHGADYLHLYTFSFSRPLPHNLTLGFEWDGTYERAVSTGAADAQFLRRISLGMLLGTDTNVTLSLRGINGNGGFALPGNNLAAAFHKRFRNGDEVFLNFGTPAASSTVNRFIVKYLMHFGGDTGT